VYKLKQTRSVESSHSECQSTLWKALASPGRDRGRMNELSPGTLGVAERRRSVRFRSLSQAHVFVTSSPDAPAQLVQVLDVSAGGIRLSFDTRPPTVGTALTVRIGAHLSLYGEIFRVVPGKDRYSVALRLEASEWGAKKKLSDQLAGKLFGTPWSFELHGLKCDPFKADVRLRALRLLVYRYPKKRLTLEEAAHLTGLGVSYFSSFFRRTTGVPFRDWLNWIRVARSIILLSSNDHSVKAVAYLAGFNNVRSFERLFRQHTSLTPRQFKQLQNPNPKRAAA